MQRKFKTDPIKGSGSRYGKQAKTADVVRTDDFLFGSPDLLPFEDAAAYEALLASVIEAVQPQDGVEEIWVRDIVALTWEMRRIRSYKARTVSEKYNELIKNALTSKIGFLEAGKAVDAWARAKPAERGKLEKQFAENGLDRDHVASQAFSLTFRVVEKFDDYLARIEFRRTVLFREMERRRDALARRLRERLQEIDGEYREVKAPVVIDQEPVSTPRRPERASPPASASRSTPSSGHSGPSPDPKPDRPLKQSVRSPDLFEGSGDASGSHSNASSDGASLSRRSGPQKSNGSAS